jgi:predicted nucleic acid-binding Zn ribbon protein
MSRPSDPAHDPRTARHRDRDERVYDRRRRADARRRARLEREAYDPAPPTDDDWVTPDPDTDGVHRVRPPTPIGADLERFLAQRGWSERLRGTRVFARWDEIVGTDLAGRCEPVRVAGGTLVIRAESQVWATQLRYLTPTLLRSAEQILGADTVREVRLVVGPLQGTQEAP